MLIFLAAIVSTILIISLLITPPQQTQAYTRLKLGKWSLHANGYIAVLDIVSLDRSGRIGVTTQIFGNTVLVGGGGTYDPATQKITFTRQVSPAERQVYVGYLFQDGRPGSSEADRMAGYIQARDPSSGIIRATVGWYAVVCTPSLMCPR